MLIDDPADLDDTTACALIESVVMHHTKVHWIVMPASATLVILVLGGASASVLAVGAVALTYGSVFLRLHARRAIVRDAVDLGVSPRLARLLRKRLRGVSLPRHPTDRQRVLQAAIVCARATELQR